eukprot:TRINITY_DN5162_c0_g1_i1.p1 TRINITY_DN5162_c0_g1~~TRINITY_DN5162_c0_g1_i1.p1  ORF type:complete len:217 (+),score=86.82 TRINITY_DN5162_c0_g1_i1:287-937(+)
MDSFQKGDQCVKTLNLKEHLTKYRASASANGWDDHAFQTMGYGNSLDMRVNQNFSVEERNEGFMKLMKSQQKHFELAIKELEKQEKIDREYLLKIREVNVKAIDRMTEGLKKEAEEDGRKELNEEEKAKILEMKKKFEQEYLERDKVLQEARVQRVQAKQHYSVQLAQLLSQKMNQDFEVLSTAKRIDEQRKYEGEAFEDVGVESVSEHFLHDYED